MQTRNPWADARHTFGASLRRRSLALASLTLLALSSAALGPAALAHDGERDKRWVGSWSASPQSPAAPQQINDQTIREIVHLSIGGERVRVRLSNAFGTNSLVVGAAHVAQRSSGASIVPGSSRALRFNGATSTTIPPGAVAVSDPVHLVAPALGDLAVSLFIPGKQPATTEHSLGRQTTYLSPPGNFADAVAMPVDRSTQSFYFLAGVEVLASEKARAIVTLGDSIADGFASTVDANKRWPNRLAERLQAHKGGNRLAVLNAGISGNRVLHDNVGPNALGRLDRDVLVQSGARFLVVLEGINDIGIPGLFSVLFPTGGFGDQFVSAEQIIAGHKQIIDRAHAMGMKVFGGTLTPFRAFVPGLYFSEEGEAKRQAVNHWIRNSKAYDAVIDFDKAVRDPSNPSRMLPIYDSGDNLHPNDAGYEAMANAVDLSLFKDED